MPTTTTISHPLVQRIQERFPDAVLGATVFRGDPSVQIKRSALVVVCQFLHDDPEMDFDYPVHITSVDSPGQAERFEVVYEFYSIRRRHRIRLKTRVSEDDAVVDSVTGIWKGANFQEREVYDMMGIRFANHPDLRRILLPEDYDEGYPLRKDFPVAGRGWRATFEFLPKDDPYKTAPATVEAEPAPAPAPKPPLPLLKTERLILNMGPQHPATHGVLRIMLELEGEKVKKAVPDLGYLHRGVEKLAEGLTYHQFIPHTDRLDYVAAMLNNYAYVRAVEKLLDLKVPPRAEYLRTIVAEMQRIIGHLFWLGTQALDIGAMTIFFWTFREREVLLDLFLEICGARLTTTWYRIGGIENDIGPSVLEALARFLKDFPAKINEYDALLVNNRIWLGRTKGIATISAEDAVNFGLSGPTLRGSGVPYDVRKFEPYGAYGEVEWEVPVGRHGDTYDRYWVRMQEMHQSSRILEQCLARLPAGPIMADDPRVVLPPKDKVFTDMDSMIFQFRLYAQGFPAPPGDIYCGTEAHKGELGFYIVSTGREKPYRMKIRAPSFINMGAFDHMARGYMIADIVTIFGTYDIVMGECDR